MEDRISKYIAKKALERMLEMVNSNDPDIYITGKFEHDPTPMSEAEGCQEWREGNRTITVTVKETKTREYYLAKYGKSSVDKEIREPIQARNEEQG